MPASQSFLGLSSNEYWNNQEPAKFQLHKIYKNSYIHLFSFHFGAGMAMAFSFN